MPPTPSIKSAPGGFVIERRQNSTTSWNAIARPWCLSPPYAGKAEPEPPRRNMLDLRQFGRAPQRQKQGGRIDCCARRRGQSADDRLDAATARPVACMCRINPVATKVCLSVPVAVMKNAVIALGLHRSLAAVRTRERTSSASRSISSSGCCAVKVDVESGPGRHGRGPYGDNQETLVCQHPRCVQSLFRLRRARRERSGWPARAARPLRGKRPRLCQGQRGIAGLAFDHVKRSERGRRHGARGSAVNRPRYGHGFE